MKSFDICTHGLYTTIAKAINVRPSLIALEHKNSTASRHILIKAIYTDLIAAQVNVLEKYESGGLFSSLINDRVRRKREKHRDVNHEIKNLLTTAENEHKRYLDLFSNPYFLNKPEKRTLAAKRYALLKVCKDITDTKIYNIKTVFEVYSEFKVASMKHYQSFCYRLRLFPNKKDLI
jgi:hypothetical protein